MEIKWREVPFDIMLRCDGEIKCECWLLNNSINKHGTDLKAPMLFNEFLRQIGSCLTSMNCQSLFKQAKWYVIDDGVQPDYFMVGSRHYEKPLDSDTYETVVKPSKLK